MGRPGLIGRFGPDGWAVIARTSSIVRAAEIAALGKRGHGEQQDQGEGAHQAGRDAIRRANSARAAFRSA